MIRYQLTSASTAVWRIFIGRDAPETSPMRGRPPVLERRNIRRRDSDRFASIGSGDNHLSNDICRVCRNGRKRLRDGDSSTVSYQTRQLRPKSGQIVLFEIVRLRIRRVRPDLLRRKGGEADRWVTVTLVGNGLALQSRPFFSGC